uniref:M-phase inducer phosphatase n=1 Tax=Magallana gigas TaxID=29159 RepID=K1QJR9_MAGGI
MLNNYTKSVMKEMSPFRLAQLPFDLDDLSLSPNDVYQLLTPKHAPRPALLDEDSGLGMDSFDKRQRRDSKGSPLTKRRKHVTPSRKRIQKSLSFGECPTLESQSTSEQNEVVEFIERVSQEEDLVGDGSTSHSLPTIPGKHADLKSITTDTVSKLLRGDYDDVIGSYQIIDCRYPYEYEGGHVKGAVNLYKEMDAETILNFKERQEESEGKRHILIFYCEFSSERGPKMYRNVRKADRALNQDNYPRLNYPEMYLIHNGYKCFFETQKTMCEPQEYKPMLHKEHAQDLRHFRAKSKSFTVGEKRKKASRLSF